jgi:transposase InsO family protein
VGCTAERLMRQERLEGVRRTRKRRTTIAGDQAKRRCDLGDRDFAADTPNRLWLSDFTYVMTWSGVVYLGGCDRRLLAADRRLEGRHLNAHRHVLDTLEMGRGWQHASARSTNAGTVGARSSESSSP